MTKIRIYMGAPNSYLGCPKKLCKPTNCAHTIFVAIIWVFSVKAPHKLSGQITYSPLAQSW